LFHSCITGTGVGGGGTDGVASGRQRAASTPNAAATAAAAAAATSAAAPAAVHRGRCNASCVDKISRKFFPTSFILFNIVYWGFYTYTASTSLDDDE